MKRNALLLLMIAAGAVLLLYPAFSDQWNKRHQSGVILDYVSEISEMDDSTYASVLEYAREYNRKLAGQGTHFTMTEEEKGGYREALNLSEDGLMGFITIDPIGVQLPVYHGTDKNVLQVGAGHVEWSSLPVVQELSAGKQNDTAPDAVYGSHCVLSGHRGLPGSRLFTDLDRLQEGDRFSLTVLNETIEYAVDQIRVVTPDDVSELGIIPGMDLCTLVTCTPYGINTHRLLVRGRRMQTDLTEWKTAGSGDNGGKKNMVGIADAIRSADLPAFTDRIMETDPAWLILEALAAVLAVFFAGVYAYRRRRWLCNA